MSSVAESIFAQIEADRLVRETEIRLLQNKARTASLRESPALRRSAVLLTYAHFEGFCKFSLGAYAAGINGLKLMCRDASYALVASTMSRAFADMRDVHKKSAIFARSLPDDSKLHRF